MYFSSTIAASAVLVLASGAVIGKRSLSGEATFYGGNVAGGTCSFSTYTLPSAIFGTALSDSNWDDAAECGACVLVTGPSGNSITAMIVDQCPGCGLNHLDLFPTAFSTLADPSVGVIDVTWDYIDCPITSPLEVVNKEGVSAYWFSMQVVNANKGVSTLEVSTDGGSTWQSTTRQPYNFFENSSGFGTTSVNVKVTSIDGDVVIIDSVPVSPQVAVTASANFGSGAVATATATAASSSSPAAIESPPSTNEAPISTPTTSAGAYIQVAPSPSSTNPVAAVVVAASPTSSSTITPAPTPTPYDLEITYVTIEACEA